MKYYEVDLSQNEIDAIWLISQCVNGKGKYYRCIMGMGNKLEPFVSEWTKTTQLSKQIEGVIIFNEI